jgi:Replication protein.
MQQPTTEQKKVFYSTIEKLKKSQEMKIRLIPYIQQKYPFLLHNPHRKQRITECCNLISFRRYLETGDIQLVSANFCKYDRICVACATKRAMRAIKKFSQGIEENNLYGKKWYYIVLTISHKQDDTLEELMKRLMTYKDRLAKAYRNSKRKEQKTKSFFSLFDWMIISIEIAHKGTNWRHPHINILACGDSDIPIEAKYFHGTTNSQLLEERRKLTDGTSYIHNIRKIEVKKDHFSRSWIGEVFKYAIKFSDLSMEQLAEVMVAQHKHQYRFFATYWIFRGWKLGEGKKFSGERSEGTFLYDKQEKKYQLIRT